MSVRPPVVVLDPGHGGATTIGGSSANNATGPNGLLEKTLTLDLAQRISRALDSGAYSVLTRSDDSNLSLEARARIARDQHASLFLSIHMNGFHDPRVNGTEVFVARNASQSSRAFAQRVLDRLLPVTGAPNRGVRERDLGVLLPSRHDPMTAAALVEISFLTNPGESQRLEQATYRQQIAAALAAAMREQLRLAEAQAFGWPSSALELVGAGREELSCPLLNPHAPGRNLILRWNIPPANLSQVDVVVHFHGYGESPLNFRDKERKSGLDLVSPSGGGPERQRPTLGLIPRGKEAGPTKYGNYRYRFDALTPHGGSAVGDMIRFSLDWFAQSQLQQPAGSLSRGRLIITAHSGGGHPLMDILGGQDPDEIETFDALYNPAGPLISWALGRIRRDAATLDTMAEETWPDYMAERGGALRVLYREGTAAESEKVHREIVCALRALPNQRLASFLREWYRVERTQVAHDDIPAAFGAQLLADAHANLQPTPSIPPDPASCPPLAAQAITAHGLDTVTLGYGVPQGRITDPFYRDPEEKRQLTGSTAGRNKHLGIDVSLTRASGGGADDERRGLPVYAALRSSIPLSELNAVRAFDKSSGRSWSGTGLSGSGDASLDHAVVYVQPWSSQADGEYGGVLGLACRYTYARDDGATGTVTIYIEYLHLITPDFLPKDGRGNQISADAWRATGKGIGFGPRMAGGARLSASDLTRGAPLLIGYLGATQFPHVHLQAAYAAGPQGYLRSPRIDPTVALQDSLTATLAQSAPQSYSAALPEPSTVVYDIDPGKEYGPKWRAHQPPGLPDSARLASAVGSAEPWVEQIARELHNDATFITLMRHLAQTESAATFARPADNFDSRPASERGGHPLITAWGTFQFNRDAWRGLPGVAATDFPWDCTPYDELMRPLGRYGDLYGELLGYGATPLHAARGVRLWQRAPGAEYPHYRDRGRNHGFDHAWSQVPAEHRTIIDRQLNEAGLLGKAQSLGWASDWRAGMTDAEWADGEMRDDRLQREPVAMSLALEAARVRPLSRPALGRTDARFADDPVSPNYRHLGESGVSQTFTFSAALIENLCRMNRFDVAGGRDEVMFGLRGCRLTEGTATGFVSAAQLSEDLPDHNDFHCVLGVWRRSSGQIALFQGSTVPNWRLMEGFRQGGERANLLPTGLYSYKVGTHRPNTRGAIPGAFIQQGEVTVARTLDDLVYTVHDLWEAGAVGDNIHPARLGRSGAGPFFSSAGCQTLPGNFGSGRHTGLWADFRSAAGLSPAVPRSENGRLYSYVLLTGRDARLAANNAVPSALVRLRFGSSGPDVQALQQGLKQSGQYRGAITGTLDAATSIAYVTWQQARDGGAADAIVTPALGRELGFDMVGQQSAAQSVRLGLGGQAVSAPTQSPSVGRTVALANSSGYASNGYSGNGHTGNGHSGNGHVEDTATCYPVNSSSNGRGARRERDVSSSYVPPNTFSLVDESFDHNVPGGVPIVAQPSGMTCWATVATMMLCWHNRPTVYTIQQAMDLAGAQYRARFDSNQGLSGAEKGQFLSAIGMRAEQQASYTPTALREMLLAYGPLWVTTDEDPSEGFAVHARIVTGIFSDGTPQGTFLRINDPAGGQQYNEVFTTFVRKYEDVAIGDVAGGSDPRIQIVHF